ncbi:MAG: Dabb family protein [Planctomycetota bacterium]|nr:MAG: Dabb family protein [Planctomycetota bacterium]
MLAHNVYFTLKDSSAEARQKLVDACRKYLKDHPGVVFFAAGTLAEELARPVNDRDFHVSLHLFFETREDHDRYQQAPEHLQFIEENQDNWERVRVFDSHVE